MTLDPAARELLQAIAAALDPTPKPETREEVVGWWNTVAGRAAVIRTGLNDLLEHEHRQADRARALAAQLRRIATGPEDTR